MLYDRDPLIMLAPAHDEDNAYVPIRKSSLAVGFDVAACCIQDPFHRGDPIGYPPVTIDPGEQVLFACETLALMIFAKQALKRLLDDYQDPEDLEIWFGTNEDITAHGITAEIWE